MFNVTKLMAVKVKRFKSLEDKNAFHYVDSAEMLMFHSCLGKKVVVVLNMTHETKVYNALVN